MEQAKQAKSHLEIAASANSSKDDFDYLVGTWKVRNRKLKSRLTGSDDWAEFDATLQMRKILLGIGNFETFTAEIDGQPFEGMALRLFDPTSRLWTIYWADCTGGGLDKNPVAGSFDGTVGKFYARDMFNETPITVLYQWDKTDPANLIWSQAFSTDEGATWEWNWYMYMTPVKD